MTRFIANGIGLDDEDNFYIISSQGKQLRPLTTATKGFQHFGLPESNFFICFMSSSVKLMSLQTFFKHICCLLLVCSAIIQLMDAS